MSFHQHDTLNTTQSLSGDYMSWLSQEKSSHLLPSMCLINTSNELIFNTGKWQQNLVFSYNTMLFSLYFSGDISFHLKVSLNFQKVSWQLKMLKQGEK